MILYTNGTLRIMVAGKVGLFPSFPEERMEEIYKLIKEGYTEEDILELISADYVSPDVKEKNEFVDSLTKYGITYDGQYFYWDSAIPLPEFMVNFIRTTDDVEYVQNNIKNFWAWSQLNPNPESRRMLFEHCRTYDIKITTSGMLILYRNMSAVDNFDDAAVARAFKVYRNNVNAYIDTDGYEVTANTEGAIPVKDFIQFPEKYFSTRFTDEYSKKMNYRIGEIAKIPREQCDETQATCSRGLKCSPTV